MVCVINKTVKKKLQGMNSTDWRILFKQFYLINYVSRDGGNFN